MKSRADSFRKPFEVFNTNITSLIGEIYHTVTVSIPPQNQFSFLFFYRWENELSRETARQEKNGKIGP